MALVVLRKGFIQGKQSNLQIVQTIVSTVLDKGFGGGESLFSGANIENGGLSAAAAAARPNFLVGQEGKKSWNGQNFWGGAGMQRCALAMRCSCSR